MSYKVAILSSLRSQSERDLGKMIEHLYKCLSEVQGSVVEKITLTDKKFVSFGDFDYVVFCGYDHVTFSHLHICLSQEVKPFITLYDEPGKSLESEINSILFRGVDCARVPVSSLSAVEYSWSYRDILSRVKQSCRSRELENPVKLESRSESSSRNTRTRQVENSGKAPASEGASADKNGDTSGG
jgi:hypothetical protein